MITERRLKTATQKYNYMMNCLALEHLTIGERLSEGTEGWNLRDMVSEAQHTLDLYYEEGTCSYEDLHYCDYWEDEDRKEIVEEAKENIKMLRKFINTYKNDIDDMTCVEGHCSKWD